MNYSNIRKIYFAHSMCDYGTEYERYGINLISKEFPGAEIINPCDIKAPKLDKNKDFKEAVRDNLVKYYFPYIDNSDLVIAVYAWNHNFARGQYTMGVEMEIEYAKSIGKEVLHFNE